MRNAIRHPLFWILVAATGLRLGGLFWGLPASDGWDDDGFAPRNFLTALALTYKPGAYFTYPPLHAFLLTVLSAPGVVMALLHAPSFHQADVISEFTKPGYMTFFAVVGRLVSLVMSLGIIWAVGEMTRLVAAGALGGSRTAPPKSALGDSRTAPPKSALGDSRTAPLKSALGDSRTAPVKARRAGLFAAGAAALNFGLTYYGQVSNLDVPYLFWGVLALLWSMRAVVEQRPRHFWMAALFAAASIATKDQAYGLFLLSLPLFLLAWFAADPWPRAHAGKIIQTVLPAIILGLLLLLLLDGAVTNWTGFVRRLAFLAGPASRDYAEYVKGPSGWLALLGDMAAYFSKGYGLLAIAFVLFGVGLHTSRARGGLRVAGLLPIMAIVSFTLCFNFAALRSDDRFLLPQAILACVYIGIAAEALAFAPGLWLRLAGRTCLAVIALLALNQAVAINAAFLFDPRYDAERWMRAHLKAGDTVETYGQNCFLPHFPSDVRVTRVGQGDLKVRNPLPGVTEIRASYSRDRGSHFVVVNAKWAERYLRPEIPLAAGHIYSRLQQADFRNDDARRHFGRLWHGGSGYSLAYAAHYAGLWPLVHIHDSLDETIWIFEKRT